MEPQESQRAEVMHMLHEIERVWKVLAVHILADMTAETGETYNTVLLVLVETTHLPEQKQFGVIASAGSPLATHVDREAYDRLLPLCRPVTIPFEEHPDDLSS